MFTISPIYQDDAEAASREFFEPSFASQRLGQPGRWLGVGAERLALKEPVAAAPFQHLLAGRTPDGARALLANSAKSKCALGWRATISAGERYSALWAVSPPAMRTRIEAVHREAAAVAIRVLEAAACGRDWDRRRGPDPQPQEGGLMAAFTSGAEPDQSPHLHTTLILFNLHFRPWAQIGPFNPDELMSRRSIISEAVEVKHWSRFGTLIGHIEDPWGSEFESCGVPDRLVAVFFANPASVPSGDQVTARSEPLAQPLPGEALFDHWDLQAEQHGWEPRETRALLRWAARHKARIDHDHFKDRCHDAVQGVAERMQRARDSLKQLVEPRETPAKPQNVSSLADLVGFGRFENRAVQAAVALAAVTGRENLPMEPVNADCGANKEEDLCCESGEKKTIFKLAGLGNFRTAPGTQKSTRANTQHAVQVKPCVTSPVVPATAPGVLTDTRTIDAVSKGLYISPIYELEAQAAGREFFDPSYPSQRLGQPGDWLGVGAERLALKGPVQAAPFQHLLAGRSPDGARSLLTDSGDPKRELGWQATISAGKRLSVLWAVSPPAMRSRIAAVHRAAASVMMRVLEGAASGRNWDRWSGPEPRPQEGALIAAFTSGAERNQSPHLHTTVFLFNLHFGPGGRITPFNPEELMSRRAMLSEAVQMSHLGQLEENIGFMHDPWRSDLRVTDVPEKMDQMCLYNSASVAPGNLATARSDPRAQSLKGVELFYHWQHQAEQLGWGPGEVSALLDNLAYFKDRADYSHFKFECQQVLERGFVRMERARDSLQRLLKHRHPAIKPQKSTQAKPHRHTQTY